MDNSKISNEVITIPKQVAEALESQEFGKYLRALRKKKCFTLSDLALQSNVAQSYINEVEIGKRGVPTPSNIRKLAKALGCTHIGMMIKAGHVTEQEVFGYIHQKESGVASGPL